MPVGLHLAGVHLAGVRDSDRAGAQYKRGRRAPEEDRAARAAVNRRRCAEKVGYRSRKERGKVRRRKRGG